MALVIPMALQNLINVGVTAADVMMLGSVSEKVLSGASLAGQIQFIMTLVFMGITSGATVLTAQYWGKGDTRTIEKILGLGLRAGLGVALLFCLAALFMPETLMHIYTNDPEVVAEGVKYLQIVAFSYLFMAFTQVYLNIMRSIERVVIATVIVYECGHQCDFDLRTLRIPDASCAWSGNRNLNFPYCGAFDCAWVRAFQKSYGKNPLERLRACG